MHTLVINLLIRLVVVAFTLAILPTNAIFNPVITSQSCQSFGKVGEKSQCTGVFYPKTIEDIIGAYRYADQHNAQITVRGSGFSFGDQCLPSREGNHPHFILSTEKLDYIEHLQNLETNNAIVLRVGAGVTWKKAITWVKQHLDMDVIPFDSPTGSDITISGAFSAHTYSRSSNVSSRYMADYINKLTVVAPGSTFICNYYDTENFSKLDVKACTLNKYYPLTESDMIESCRLLPGSLGKIGVITNLEIRLQKINDGNCCVQNEVFYESYNLNEFLQKYVQVSKIEKIKGQYDHGVIGVLQWTTVDEFRGFLLGATTADVMHTPFPSFPGFDGPSLFNQLGYALAHTLTSSQFNEKGLLYYTKKGSTGVDTPYDWTYFQDNLVEAGRTLENHPWLSWLLNKTLGVNTPLKIAHQAWFIPGDNTTLLKSFIQDVWWLIHNSQLGGVKNMVLLQDLLRIPASRHPSHITHSKGHGHTYTLTLAIHNEKEEEQAINFLKEVTKRSFTKGVIPLLLKGHYVPDSILKASQKTYTQKIKEVTGKTDPNQRLSSALWQRLLKESP